MNSPFIDFIDPSPAFEESILNRAKKQIEISATLEKVSGLMDSLSSHFTSIHEEISQLSGLLQELSCDMPFTNALPSFGQMFNTWGKQFVSQSNFSLQIIKKFILPSIKKFSEEYAEVNQHYLKTIDTYAALDRKAKNDEVLPLENSFVKSTTARTGLLYALDNQVGVCENTAVQSISLAIAQLVSLSANNMKQYLEENQETIIASEKCVASLHPEVKHRLSQNFDMHPDNNPATNAALAYWNIRFSQVPTKHLEEYMKPNTIVWLKETHALGRPTWTRHMMTFSDSILRVEKLPQAATALSSLTNFTLGQAGSQEDLQQQTQIKQWILPLVTVAPTDKNRRFTFKIQSPQELIEIQSISKVDLQEWITVFTNHNMKMLGQEEEKSDKICADCGAADATWCSVNWACDLCLKCSGVHRALSSTNSKVRSATLDKLHPMVISMMEKLQGECNKLLLATPPQISIDARTDEQTRIDYITRKYLYTEWAISGPVPDPFEAIMNHDLHSLFYAAHFGRIDDVDDSITPLHAACSIGDRDAVALLAYCATNLNVRDRKGWTPLCYAVFFQYVDIVEFLLQTGANPRDVGINLYQLAIATKNRAVAKLILVVADPTRNDDTEFTPCTLKYAPPNTPPNYTLTCKNKYSQ